ncbi:MAG: SDR family NAD(P)-dependent oxidoreductase [Flavobacteriales bacterium]
MQKKSCVLVTGAATGIGRAITQMFADRGWFVAVADIDEAGVQQVAQMLGANAVQSMGIKLSTEDVAKVVWKAAHAPRWIPQVHWTVGLEAQFFYSMVGLMPNWVNRTATRWIARQH